jgi:uncharacterized membrane protein YfbV (UPF0208 family)
MTIEIAAVLIAVLAVGVTIAGMMPAGFRRITDQLTAAARERAHITERMARIEGVIETLQTILLADRRRGTSDEGAAA